MPGRGPRANDGHPGQVFRQFQYPTVPLAVYPQEAINGHRAFITRRRALRPAAEYRVPTDAEWAEFTGHFERRKVALGDCGRSYDTPCIHEHAPLTELTTMFQQFMACFRLLALTCPRDRIG